VDDEPVLLHLTTQTEWRAALDGGSVRPPSLADVGFVHLSAPAQVHLPAERLFPGRRDVVLLVVDPARLSDPVRWEPGVPGDPESMRFPHLYGPLPASAVVAVLPWRAGAPLDLPRPDDAGARARAMSVSVPVRRAAEVREVPGGLAVLDPAFPHSRDDNRLLLTAAVDADAVEAATAQVANGAGWPERRATLLHPGAEPVAGALAQRGWDVSPGLVLAHRSPGHAVPAGAAEQVPRRAVHELWNRAWRRELGGQGAALEEIVAQLIGREHRTDLVVRVVDLAVREGDQLVAAAQLHIDGATASIASVMTDPGSRRRGHGNALVSAALHRAAQAGCDLVVLEAAELDWSQHWYPSRGFAQVGRTFDVGRS